MINIIYITDAPYRDTPPDSHYLTDGINEAIKEGYRMLGTPFVYKNEHYPVMAQIMIKEAEDE